MKNKIQQNNHTTKSQTFQLMLPFDVGVKIDAEESVQIGRAHV